MTTTTLKSDGYMIQDNQGNAIFGIGETVDEAWAMVVDGVGHFFDAYGNDIPEDKAFETQFRVYGATAALMAKVAAEGGAIAWGEIGGVACTREEEEANS